jgi:hypothetical protein
MPRHDPCYRGAAMSRIPAFLAAALAAACATTQAPGTYEAILPAASGAGERHVRVTLRPNGEAALSSAFSERPSRFLVQGIWKQEGARITADFEDQKTIVFELAGNQLVAKEWDRARWGEKGPGALFRVDR